MTSSNEAVRALATLPRLQKRVNEGGTYLDIEKRVAKVRTRLTTRDALTDKRAAVLEAYWRDVSQTPEQAVKLLGLMQTFGLLDYWFIQLKHRFSAWFYRLFELQHFAPSYSRLYRSGGTTNWLDTLLNRVYDELLVATVDPTLFYSGASLRALFGERHVAEPTVGEYIQKLVLDAATERHDLFRDFLEEGDIIRLRERDLDRYYADAETGYYCIDYVEGARGGATYRIVHFKARRILFETMVVLFDALREYYAGGVGPDGGEETLFDVIRVYLSSLELSSEQEALLHERPWEETLERMRAIVVPLVRVTPIPEGVLRQRLERAFAAVARELLRYPDASPYTVLFDDDFLYDSELRVNREKYRWLLPFNEPEFVAARLSMEGEAKTTRDVAQLLLRQEARMWLNLLRYKQQESDKKKRQKRGQLHEGGEEEVGGSRKRGRLETRVYAGEGECDILCVTAGMGRLAISQPSGERVFYALEAGARIELARTTRYEIIAHDEEDT